MGALFRNKAKSEGLMMFASPAHEARGDFTDTFKLWCVKLKDLQVENFACGTLEMEKRAEEIYRTETGKKQEMWPPSFAEFRAICFPCTDYDRQAHRMAPSSWDPVAQCYRLEDQTAKAERYKTGAEKTGALLDMLGDTKKRIDPEQEAEAKEFARQRLADAQKRLNKPTEDRSQ
jgi:hypothetical protein